MAPAADASATAIAIDSREQFGGVMLSIWF
jgi:hypothetical protein